MGDSWGSGSSSFYTWYTFRHCSAELHVYEIISKAFSQTTFWGSARAHFHLSHTYFLLREFWAAVIWIRLAACLVGRSTGQISIRIVMWQVLISTPCKAVAVWLLTVLVQQQWLIFESIPMHTREQRPMEANLSHQAAKAVWGANTWPY